jgi:type I restriction enzyme, S subunit
VSETYGGWLPNGWIRTTLESVATIHDELRRPVNASERELRPGSVPYYGATGQVGWIDDYLLDGEYVLLGEDGAPFLDATKPKAYIISGKSWVNNHAHVLRAVEDVSTNRFLLYALNATDYREAVNGTTRLKLTQAAMRELTLPIPPLAEQRRIVAAIEEQFTRLDAGVAALKRAQVALKRYRAATLKAAVEGKLTEQWRAQHADVRPARIGQDAAGPHNSLDSALANAR